MKKRAKRRKIQRRNPDRIPPQLPEAKGRIIRRRPDSFNRGHKFTRSKRRILVEALRHGVSIKRACGLAGISETTYRSWLEIGKDKTRPSYHHFRKQIKRIDYEIEKEALRVIRSAYRGGKKITETKIVQGAKGTEITRVEKEIAPSWQAAAWRLERKYIEDYGRNRKEDIQDRSPEEMAHDIKQAADVLFNSVPNGNGTQNTDIPKDMPD